MSYALILHRETNGTNGGAIASSGSTTDFRTRKLTDMIVNQQFSVTENTVNAFRSSAVANPSQFDLLVGVYRIYAEVTLGAATGGDNSKAMLYNVTDSLPAYHYGGGSEPIISTTAFLQGSGTKNVTNVICYIDTQFSVIGTTKTFEIRQAVFAGITGVATTANTAGVRSKITVGTPKEVYVLMKITRLS